MPGGLRVISGKDAVKAFKKAGWKLKRIGSSRHIIMKKEGAVTKLSILGKMILAPIMGSYYNILITFKR